ncbi:MAG: hypothetical protein RMY64_06695 [Nostoc sp. DedQUE08]|uniref:hypothetical protein n=1 Tax=unclassified Nostoc TaxID=2593658 RepID=UPI002AD2B061|nr:MULTISPECIES: hypothetical protein [unclassified Nostoc]MDZ8065314.1 hypothetical protein [Nostoc sp. DedQUE08]MDZ8091916.1 hypothetical protein [Nostoc sp. DedQUE05]
MVYHVKFISCFDGRSPTHCGDWRSLFLTNRRGAENTESEGCDRTVEIWRSLFYNEPQRHREH